MIIARIEGGLGNQMFIYAAARSLALHTGRMLKLDVHSVFDVDTYGRSYQLRRFNIQAQEASEEDVTVYKVGSVSLKRLRRVNRLLPFNWRSLIEEKSLFDPRMLQFRPKREKVYLIGYWQREEYFKKVANLVRQELTLKVELSKETLAKTKQIRDVTNESVCLHARRIAYEHLLPKSYYEKAFIVLQKHVKSPYFFIFSDDFEWVQKNLNPPGPFEFVTHNGAERDFEDLWLMSQCRHAIIANSSFSWWGAWLNENPGKVVIAPAEWGYRASPCQGWITVQ
ncbi:MAG: alpha-1,2-fucosyltransferase [Desulfobacterales bacterium]